MQTALAIFVGGGAGSVLRWLVSNGVAQRLGLGFPWGTLAVNVIGCGVLGLLTGWLAARGHLSELWRLALVTGVLGGYTTFSAFSLDALTLWQRGEGALAAGYMAASVALGLLALVGGMAVFRLI
ncbi:MAG TPA: fluoride efflux transporter CrcB [Alphaproteobacteria bacterium]|nr:fluoride efflux transporter CrcB [Alphaproteobacteria bacterium]